MMAFVRRRRSHEDFSNEIHTHLDIEADRLVSEGWSRERAEAEARRVFGNVALVKECFYETSRWMWLEQFIQDLRYATTTLRHNPTFFATAVLTLSMSIGLATVAFTVLNAYVLRPYAVREPSSLYQIGWRSQNSGGRAFRWIDYQELGARVDLFDGVVAESTRFVTSHGRPLAAALVSDNYFDLLGPAVLLGRTSLERGDGDPLILSHEAWTRLFARDSGVIGTSVDLNGHPFRIVAVLRPEFVGLGDSPRDIWVPLTAYAALSAPELIKPTERAIEITARLRHDVSAGQAAAALTPFMASAVADAGGQVRAEVEAATPNRFSAAMLAALSPIFAAFALVVVTACANVSNLMLARAVARHREIAVRLSLGASRNRIVRQLITEGLLISVASGLGALALAASGLHAAVVAFFRTLPPSVSEILRLVPLNLDWRVFLFAFGTAVLATALFALIPAVQASRFSLTDAVRGPGGTGRHGSRLRQVMVIAQVAVSLVLVIVAVTLARNGLAVGSLNLGYQTAGVLSINIRGSEGDLMRRLAPLLESDPRVAELAVTGGNPLFVRSRSIAAAPAGATSAIATRYTFISPEYFTVLGVAIAGGRGFFTDEARTEARVAIVSEATAHRFWPDDDPIGKSIRIERPGGRPVDEVPGYEEVTVVGVAPDLVSGLIVDGRDAGHIYFPTSANSAHAIAALVRARTPRDLSPEALQDLFRRVAPDPQVFEVLPLEEMRALQIYPLKAASSVGFLLGALALILSVSGLYGVLTYMLSQRTREIGIRMALGATAAGVVRLMVRQSARLTALGGAIGLVIAFASLKILNAAIQLNTISLVDAAAFASGVAAVAAATIVAVYHPARRATRIDPAAALRAE
jgi:putative ABC transport system permease protein